jgi:hypothetical protein
LAHPPYLWVDFSAPAERSAVPFLRSGSIKGVPPLPPRRRIELQLGCQSDATARWKGLVG